MSGQHTPENAGLRVVTPGGQTRVDGNRLTDIGPHRDEFVENILEELVPTILQTVEQVAHCRAGVDDLADIRLGQFVDDYLAYGLGQLPDVEADTTATDRQVEVRQWYGAVARLSRDFQPLVYGDKDLDEISKPQRAVYQSIRGDVVSVGTGRGPMNAGLPALRRSAVALLQEAALTPVVTLYLDGDAWTDVEDKRTVERALDALTALSQAVDLRLVISPTLQKRLTSQHPAWTDTVENLTDPRDSSPERAPVEEDVEAEAWTAVSELANSPGRLRIVAEMRARETRALRDIGADDAVGISEGSVYRYVSDLQDAGLVEEADTAGRGKDVRLTDAGRAAQEFIAPDGSTVPPAQEELPLGLTATHQSHASTVYGASSQEGGRPASTVPAEDALAATGAASNAGFVQWLPAAGDDLSKWEMHQRYLSGRRGEGVTLVDEDVHDWDAHPDGDGRVTYLSCFDDHTQVFVQWGGPLWTLARLATTLISQKAFSKILTPSACGSSFRETFDGAFGAEAGVQLRDGSQVGWFSGDEVDDYEAWKDRWLDVRSELLAKAADATHSDDTEERRRIFERLHGFLASATAMYNAVGVDVTTQLRIPNTMALATNESELRNFKDFCRYTMTKQAVYGDVHSFPRQTLEHRPEKLQWRAPLEFDESDPFASTTMDWVISGPQATRLQEDIETAVDLEDGAVRDRVQDGEEQAPALEIPVQNGNTYRALRDVIEHWAEVKDYGARQTKNVRRLVRLFDAVLGTEHRHASPFDVAEVMMRLGRSRGPHDELTTRDLQNVLVNLPGDRLLRDLPPSARRMFNELLASDDQLTRQDLIDISSEASVERHWQTLEAVGLVEKTETGWTASLLPSWVPVDEETTGRTWLEILYDAGTQMDADLEDERWLHPQDRGELLAMLDIEWLHPIFRAFFDDGDEPPDEDNADVLVARIGRVPSTRPRQQASLESSIEPAARAD
jgi:hypothetical protein